MSLTNEELIKILPSDGPSINEVKKYLSKYKNEFIILKIGSVLIDTNLFKTLIEDICILKKLGFNPILIHGGGKKLTNKLDQSNIKSDFINGLRITDNKIINVVEEVFLKFNKEIINEIKKHSINTASINNKENNIILVKKINEQLGFVGKPTELIINVLQKIIGSNKVPVIAPLGLDSEGQVYNVNADDIASFVAKKLNARRLLFVSDTVVFDKNKKLISEINSEKTKELIKNDIISGGMVVKINNCLDVVINSKVKGVCILDGKILRSVLFELLSSAGSGTLIRK